MAKQQVTRYSRTGNGSLEASAMHVRGNSTASNVARGGAKAARKASSAAFSSSRAQKWVLTSALMTAVIYLVRHLVEGEGSPAPATNTARAFLGQGSPPNLGQFVIAYGTAFLGLSLLTVIAPEVAASIAMFMLAATFLESGGQLAVDLQKLESGIGSGDQTYGVTGTASAAAGGTGGGIASTTLAPSPSAVGAGVKGITGKVTGSPGLKSVTAAATAQGLVYDPATNTYVPRKG